MEIKQLEYFVATADCGSINKAAEILYTSQPNVSKVINAFEKEMGVSFFYRTNKGVRLTEQGKKIYEYAKIVLKNANMMTSAIKKEITRKFSVSCYPSHMISRVFIEFYNSRNNENINLEFYEGTVEEITDHVAHYLSEIGIVYFSENQLKCFNHIMGHKKLEFNILDKREACIYVGENNPLFKKDMVKFEELHKLKFVQPIKDLFSLEHHLESISVGAINMENFNNIIQTNSDNLTIDLLLNTDVCSFGIDFMNENYEQYKIKPLSIKGCTKCLLIGYVKHKDTELTKEATEFINYIKKTLKESKSI
ncbi:LysR family transcriptional regulator [Clostridium sp. SHJSY1]|uniref:LysR family transcriptional regulator n=1 Tax=Clostridium sp. SHJSY1 TaxID=2942483 RepID=UPI002874AAF6|nr:LysR family transcriptional regulator [Clostridium sp. SHJSY1]MDS0526890.1 LysR family transcriptional regulator [Clostridium sp. SHJSY1]